MPPGSTVGMTRRPVRLVTPTSATSVHPLSRSGGAWSNALTVTQTFPWRIVSTLTPVPSAVISPWARPVLGSAYGLSLSVMW